MPTFGLFLTSLMSPVDIAAGGWWQIFTKPSIATLESYRQLLENETIAHSLLTTLQIAVGGTVLPILVAALAAYAFAWLEFPGRDWLFILVIGCWSCRCRWR